MSKETFAGEPFDPYALKDEITRLRAELAAVTAERDYVMAEGLFSADQIRILRTERDTAIAERDRMRDALKPFAAQLDHPGTIYEHDGVRIALVNQDILDRLYLDARAALEGVTEKEGAGNE